MKREQVLRLLKVAIISTLIIFAFEAIFAVPEINSLFANLIVNSNGIWAWIVIWLLFFLQTNVLNIPAYTLLSACSVIGMNTLSFEYISVVLSAYMVGCIVSYWLGRKFGTRAIKWCAGNEQEFIKWSNFINSKGKFVYFLTVILPFAPDDLLCLICGSVKMNFGFYLIANLIGRGVGLVTMLYTLKFIGGIGGSFPIMLVVWGIALICEIIAFYILNKKVDKKK